MEAVEERSKVKLQQAMDKILNKDNTKNKVEEKDQEERVQDEEEKAQDDVVEVEDDEEGSEDSDEAYYNNRVFERKECDITYEWDEEEETPKKANFSYDENAKGMGDQTMNEFVHKLIEEEAEQEEAGETEKEKTVVFRWLEEKDAEPEKDDTVEIVDDVPSPEPLGAVVPPLQVTFNLSSNDSFQVEEPEPEPAVLQQPVIPRQENIYTFRCKLQTLSDSSFFLQFLKRH